METLRNLHAVLNIASLHLVERMAVPGMTHPLVTSTEDYPIIHPGEEPSQVSLTAIFAGTASPEIYI